MKSEMDTEMKEVKPYNQRKTSGEEIADYSQITIDNNSPHNKVLDNKRHSSGNEAW